VVFFTCNELSLLLLQERENTHKKSNEPCSDYAKIFTITAYRFSSLTSPELCHSLIACFGSLADAVIGASGNSLDDVESCNVIAMACCALASTMAFVFKNAYQLSAKSRANAFSVPCSLVHKGLQAQRIWASL
jgi:hypothetical protein